MSRDQYTCEHKWTELNGWHCRHCFVSRCEWREFRADTIPDEKEQGYIPPILENKNWEYEHGLPRSYPGYNPEHCLVADPKPKTFTNGR